MTEDTSTAAIATLPPLRLMIYDSSDRVTNIKRLRAGLSDEANKVIDNLLPTGVAESDFDVPLGLTYSWFAGGGLYRGLGRIDDYRGFATWAEALAWLTTAGGVSRQISQIQYWGHGSPGRVWMTEDGALDRYSVSDGARLVPMLRSIRSRMTPDAMIWFRCCGVFAGQRGHDFASAWSEFFQRRVAAHTHIIGFWHAGLHNAWPGKTPHWPKTEGLDDRGRVVVSSRRSPNRTWFLGNRVPEGW